jgi:hypothetical protein
MEGKPTTRSPVPINKILILGLVLSANNISIYAILAFLPFLVEFYFPGIDVRDIGNKAGLVGSFVVFIFVVYTSTVLTVH